MEATREVGKVVSGIQNGTNDNLMAMQESTKRVNRSTELALSAGESLAAIVTIAEMTASQDPFHCRGQRGAIRSQ